MADGVPAAEVYDALGTPEGVDRAFAKLDTIKDDIVWWEAGAQPPQLLADGEVDDDRPPATAASSTRRWARASRSRSSGTARSTSPRATSSPRARRTSRTRWSSSSSPPARSRSPDQAELDQLRPGAQVLRARSSACTRTARPTMAPHMPTSEANLGNALPVGLRVLGRPRFRAQRALQRLARQLTDRAGRARHRPRAPANRKTGDGRSPTEQRPPDFGPPTGVAAEGGARARPAPGEAPRAAAGAAAARLRRSSPSSSRSARCSTARSTTRASPTTCRRVGAWFAANPAGTEPDEAAFAALAADLVAAAEAADASASSAPGSTTTCRAPARCSPRPARRADDLAPPFREAMLGARRRLGQSRALGA